MANKIILTGNLAKKFRKEVPFSGLSIRDALLCLDANFPEFRSYLVSAAEKGIDFTFRTAKRGDISDVYLNLVDGDLFITAIPAGAKSGGAKIAAAVAITALLVFSYGAAGGATAGGTGNLFFKIGAEGAVLSSTGQITSQLAVSLALAGIQQLLAPDPSVDDEEEGYLFNGVEQTITEGAPVPVLYGELAVPGYPVSFEAGSDSFISSQYSVIQRGGGTQSQGIYTNIRESDRNEDTEAAPHDFTKGVSSDFNYSKSQTILFTDIISEGPIYGLVNDGASIYLNGDPAQTQAVAACRCEAGPAATVESGTVDPSQTINLISRNAYQGNDNFNWHFDQNLRPQITQRDLYTGSSGPYLGRVQFFTSDSTSTDFPPGTIRITFTAGRTGSIEGDLRAGPDLSDAFEENGKIVITALGRTITILMSEVTDTSEPYVITRTGADLTNDIAFADALNAQANQSVSGTITFSLPSTSSEGKIILPKDTPLDLTRGSRHVTVRNAFHRQITSISLSSDKYNINVQQGFGSGVVDYINKFTIPIKKTDTVIAEARVVLRVSKRTIISGHLNTVTGTGTTLVVSPFATSTDASAIISSGDEELDVFIDTSAEVGTRVSDAEYTSSDFSNIEEGDYNYDIQSANTRSLGSLNNASKYHNFRHDFKVGHPMQNPIIDGTGLGLGRTVLPPGTAFSSREISKFQNGDGTPEIILGLTENSGFGVRNDLATSVKEVFISFQYPQLFHSERTSGNKVAGTVLYDLYVNGVWNRTIIHSTESQTTLIRTERIALTPADFVSGNNIQFRIVRLTNNDTAYQSTINKSNYQLEGQENTRQYEPSTAATILSVGSVLKETLLFPFTAMAKVQISSKDFSSVPSRAYHCKGMLIKVPSNYKTRDETGETAEYDGLWDGTFRNTKVYCNNPAWVLFDILTNSRYGLGDWIEESDLNIYSFYKIARFCDELVPDGKGGMEPRFTTNVYLRNKTEAYKVIKDLASTFTGILHWIDGQAHPVADERLHPVYIFNTSNIIDGEINIETTGARTRTNQVVVSWNNPDNNYKLEPLIVEDEEHIIKTGQINSSEAVAFGATSFGQARRYGRWKIWTARNQTEVISFKTSISATFLYPGDVIVVPNHLDLQGNPSSLISGRITSVNTNNNRIRIDKQKELRDAGHNLSNFKIVVVLTEGVAISTETESFETGGNTINPGDVVPGITSELDAFNFTDASGKSRILQWANNTYTKTLSAVGDKGWFTATGDLDKIPVGATWIAEQLSSTEPVVNKEYKILGIVEEDPNEYTITAVEYFREKYDSIDDEDFVVNVQDPVYKIPDRNSVVPAPRNVYVVVGNLNSGELMDDVTLYYDPPINPDGTPYTYVSHYLIEHEIYGIPNPVKVNKDSNSLTGLDLPAGIHTIGMRTVNSFNQRSDLSKTTFIINNPALQAVPRQLGVALGAVVTSPVGISATGEFSTSTANWAISPAGNPNFVKIFSSILRQDCSGLLSKNYSTMATDRERTEAAGYIFFDASDDDDPFKLVLYRTENDLPYLYFSATGDETETGFVEINKRLTIPANSVVVTGTDFTSDYQVGDTLKLTGDRIAKVAYIVSDTDMRIDRSFNTAISDASPERLEFRFDRNNDCVFAQVRNNNGAFEFYPINLSINEFLVNFNNVIFTATPSIIQFKNGTLVTSHSNIVLRASAIGFAAPEFLITGSGFEAVTQSAESTFSSPTSENDYVKTLSGISSFTDTHNDGNFDTDMTFTVTIREKDNTSKTTSATINLPVFNVTDGADGADGSGDDGDDGVPGARQTIGYVYFQSSSASTPSTPTASSYNFSTGQLSGLSASWAQTPPTIDAGSSDSNWTSRFTVTETAYSATTGRYTGTSISFTTPSKGFTFNGVVTFTSGDKLKVNGADITNIDGGFIKTGTIALNTLKAETWSIPDPDDATGPGTDNEFAITLRGKSIAGHDVLGYFNAAGSNPGDLWAVGIVADSSQRGGLGVLSAAECGACFYRGTLNNITSEVRLISGSNAIEVLDRVAPNNPTVFRVRNDGTVESSVDLIVTSDIAIKTNLKPITNALDKLEQLTGYIFTKFENIEQAGVIAQEVEKILPEAVIESDSGLKGVSYGSLIALLVQAIKELRNLK